LNPDDPIAGLADSKKLTECRREILAEEIRGRALAWALGRAEPDEIDEINILQASLRAMARAVEQLGMRPGRVLVDGNRLPEVSCPAEAIVGGDSLVDCISAASILAKVTRDAEMREMDLRYPGFGFAGHKGYPTARHLEALGRLGITPIHRRSFSPVRKILENR